MNHCLLLAAALVACAVAAPEPTRRRRDAFGDSGLNADGFNPLSSGIGSVVAPVAAGKLGAAEHTAAGFQQFAHGDLEGAAQHGVAAVGSLAQGDATGLHNAAALIGSGASSSSLVAGNSDSSSGISGNTFGAGIGSVVAPVAAGKVGAAEHTAAGFQQFAHGDFEGAAQHGVAAIGSLAQGDATGLHNAAALIGSGASSSSLLTGNSDSSSGIAGSNLPINSLTSYTPGSSNTFGAGIGSVVAPVAAGKVGAAEHTAAGFQQFAHGDFEGAAQHGVAAIGSLAQGDATGLHNAAALIGSGASSSSLLTGNSDSSSGIAGSNLPINSLTSYTPGSSNTFGAGIGSVVAPVAAGKVGAAEHTAAGFQHFAHGDLEGTAQHGVAAIGSLAQGDATGLHNAAALIGSGASSSSLLTGNSGSSSGIAGSNLPIDSLTSYTPGSSNTFGAGIAGVIVPVAAGKLGAAEHTAAGIQQLAHGDFQGAAQHAGAGAADVIRGDSTSIHNAAHQGTSLFGAGLLG